MIPEGKHALIISSHALGKSGGVFLYANGGNALPRKPGEAYVNARMKQKERQYNANRPARHEFYSSTQWRRMRERYRRLHPLCEECQRQGIVTAAELVHHKVEIADGGAPLDSDNLESLCWSCHSRIHSVNG